MKGLVRLRAAAERFRQSLLALPVLVVAGLVGLAVLGVAIDHELPGVVDPLVPDIDPASSRAVLSTIATGLVAGAALVFSSILVSIQLASSQFSPRTMRGFLGDRRQQATIGLLVGTVAHCLVVLLATGSPSVGSGGGPFVPQLSVLVSAGLGLASLLAIVASVNDLAQSLQVEQQLVTIQRETQRLVERVPRPAADEPAPDGHPPDDAAPAPTVPVDADAVLAPVSGWVQQVSIDALLSTLPAGGGVAVDAHVGTHVWRDVPLARAWSPDGLDDEHLAGLRGAFALGPQRTMQEDVGFGLVRLVDVALLALSPGLNDQNTAIDVIGRIGVVLRDLGARPDPPTVYRRDDRVVRLVDPPRFADHVALAVTPIRSAAAAHVQVARALVVTLTHLIGDLGQRAPQRDTTSVRDELAALVDEVARGPLGRRDQQQVTAPVPPFWSRPRTPAVGWRGQTEGRCDR